MRLTYSSQASNFSWTLLDMRRPFGRADRRTQRTLLFTSTASRDSRRSARRDSRYSRRNARAAPPDQSYFVPKPNGTLSLTCLAAGEGAELPVFEIGPGHFLGSGAGGDDFDCRIDLAHRLDDEVVLFRVLVDVHVAPLPGPVHLIADAPDLHAVGRGMSVGRAQLSEAAGGGAVHILDFFGGRVGRRRARSRWQCRVPRRAGGRRS